MDRGDKRPPHVEDHGLNRGSLLGGEAPEEPVEGPLLSILPNPLHRPLLEVEDDRGVLLAAVDGLLVDALSRSATGGLDRRPRANARSG